MTERETFFKQLMRRRVPQIVGTYVAALWLVVEIGGWVIEQFGLPTAYALYLFVLLIVLLPSVILLAWRHGAPGPDTWGRMEQVAVPVNVLMALAALFLVIQVRPPVVPTGAVSAQPVVVERTLLDESGQELVYQAAREGYGISILTLFWPAAGESSAEPSWESYAAPWLVSADLGQDPLITGGVAFDRSVIERLAAAGFEDGVGEPLSLGLSIAADNGTDFLIRGEYERQSDGYLLRAEVYAVADGTRVDRAQAAGPTLVAAADALGSELGELLVRGLDRGEASYRPMSLEERTTTDPLAIEPFIRGIRSMLFDSDFDATVEFLQAAVDIDPTFAPAWAWLHQVQRLRGDLAASNEAIEKALAHDYKLDTESRLALRANQYAIAGDLDRAIRVIRMWTEVQPYSLRAWITLTRNLLLIGEIDEARESNKRAKSIDPDRASLDRTRAQIEELAGNFELASEVLVAYLDAEPQDDTAWISLGDVRLRAGDSDGAREAYDRAGFVASNAFRSRERLLRLEARSGDPQRAVAGYRRALQGGLQPTEEAALVQEFIYALDNLGRVEEALSLIDNHGSALEQTLAPMVRTLTIEGMRAGLLTSLGRFEEALGLIDRAQQQVAGPFGALFALVRIPIFEETGNLNAAQASLENLRELVETFDMPGQRAQLNAAAARVLAMQADYEGALARLGDAKDALHGTSLSLLSPVTDPLTAQAAEYRIDNGQPAQALEILDGLLATYPNYGQARLLRARALQALGRSEDAAAELTEVSALYESADPDYQALIEARQLADQWGIALANF
ncbi:MAG: tetratricopeptide repeat protein [Wenzhouxiangella sp.]|jgi:tetratricopeptide (TPR) repeat protein|nr:tetratricopeptide repeat protein [Wenzhouxiangella sp.]